MKLMRSTGIMSVLVIALAIYTFFDYRKAQREGVLAEDERVAFSFSTDEVDTILIQRPEESIELRKEGEDWKMVKPVADIADEAGILAFLYTLHNQRVRQFSADGEDKKGEVEWKRFGLDQPLVTFELHSGSKSEKVAMSAKNAYDGSFYLRQKNELLMGDTGWAQLRDRPASVFRSRQLWRSSAPIEKAQIDIGSQKFTLLKKDGQWTMEPKPSFALDLGQIEDWIARVKDFKPAEIAKDGLADEDRKTFLLTKPSMQIRLNDQWLLTLGQDRAEDVFLYTNQSSTLYRISTAGLATIRVPMEFFRDGRKPFEFPVERAQTIEIKTGKLNQILKKSDTTWVSTDASVPVNQDQLIQFMQTLRGLEAHEFGASAKTGIASPQVIVKDEEGKAILTLAWGNEYKARQAYNQGRPLVFARTNLEKEVVGIPKEKVNFLASDALVKVDKK